jgi:hypothetical protein
VCNNIRHQLDIHQDIEALREDPLSLHLGDQCLNNRLLTEDHNTNNNVDHNNNSLGCSTEQTRVPGRWAVNFYFRYQEYWTEERVLDMWRATLPA